MLYMYKGIPHYKVISDQVKSTVEISCTVDSYCLERDIALYL